MSNIENIENIDKSEAVESDNPLVKVRYFKVKVVYKARPCKACGKEKQQFKKHYCDECREKYSCRQLKYFYSHKRKCKNCKGELDRQGYMCTSCYEKTKLERKSRYKTKIQKNVENFK